MTTLKIKETYKFTHKNIDIYVKIDYANNAISIVEPLDKLHSSFKKKDFTFIGRGVEYMQGWRNILEAISKATEDAQAKYEEYRKEQESAKQEVINEAVLKMREEDLQDRFINGYDIQEANKKYKII